MKLCKDCANFRIYRKCNVGKIDLVDGTEKLEYAAVERIGSCGPHALRFKQKPLRWYQRLFVVESKGTD